MNLLAHAFLAGHSDEWLAGAILGDFVKGAVPQWYPLATQQSLRLHRRIDMFTDSHPLNLASRQLVHRSRRRYAGILVDVFYDHFLACHWLSYSQVPLTTFTQRIYQALQAHAFYLPGTLHKLLPRLIADDRLASYRHISAIRSSLTGLGHRFRHPIDLGPGVDDLLANYAEFERQFDDFFPLLRAYSKHTVATSPALNAYTVEKRNLDMDGTSIVCDHKLA